MATHLRRLAAATSLVAALLPAVGSAQLTDITQTGPTVPGGAIGKSLEQQIGAARGDIDIPQSSLYIIARDPARAVRRGRQLFQRKFTIDQGFGPRVNFDSTGSIAIDPSLGAGLVDSCAGCHGRPRGSAGAGGNVVTRPDSRDAPHLFGLGLVEMLADEITADLRRIRSNAVAFAEQSHQPARRSLLSKGISYGSITGLPDGNVDTSDVSGVDSDLRVRPFFAQGGTISIREFTVGAFKAEMGLEVPDPDLCAATDPVNPVVVTTPAGMVLDPALDRIERPAVCDATVDHDGDGVVDEVDPALVDYLEFYLLNYFKPGTGRATDRSQQGLALMRAADCTSCHHQSLKINVDRRVADVEVRHDEDRGIFNHLYATAAPLFQTIDDGNEYPQQRPVGAGFQVKNIFTDLKRHDLGSAFYERQHDGTLVTKFVTEPLWGVGTTAPYGHDGRSINLEEVILRHGGEAQASRDRFAALSPQEQDAIIDFLNTLVLFPPDDTASNLDSGVPGGDPQTQHGSIALSVLFQIPDPDGLGE
jgi:hypothetical protein